VVAHASYLVNISSVDDDLWEESIAGLSDELVRAATIGSETLVLHPGSFRGADRAFGIERAAVALRRVLAQTASLRTHIAVETTAGSGSVLGGRFEEIAEVLQRLPRGRMEVCLDTCHVHAAGYDITTSRRLTATLGEFDSLIGLSRLAVIHRRGELGSHLDRHEHIGKGRIGPDPFRRIMRMDRLRGLPKILETPKHDRYGRSMDSVNLKVLSRFAQ
jgi:deoxyribonuclease-4